MIRDFSDRVVKQFPSFNPLDFLLLSIFIRFIKFQQPPPVNDLSVLKSFPSVYVHCTVSQREVG